MNLDDVQKNKPPARHIEDARNRIRQQLIDSAERMVVVDDDPTGPQAVHGVRVYMDWSVNALQKAFRTGGPVFFICTNSRGMNPADMRKVTLEVGRNINEAARLENVNVLLTSRSDSTLRGHFPGEVQALLGGTGLTPDGLIFAPALFEAGRYTIDDTQYAEIESDLLPVHLTEFSRDPSFPYRNSNLKMWMEEKTGGITRAGDVISIPLETIREGGPEAVTRLLMQVSGLTPVIVNAAGYDDLDIVSLGIADAEKAGKSFIYRCSASFIKSRGGFTDKPLLTYRELKPGQAPGLIIAGSYVEKTTRQLNKLFDSRLAEGIELNTDRVTDSRTAGNEIKRVSDYVNNLLREGRTAAIYTTRAVNTTDVSFQETGKTVMSALCRVVESVTGKPGFIIAKGGITSIEIARTALRSSEAFSIGQILPGVPVWRLPGSLITPDIPYVVFPGNVGNDDALVKAVRVLTGR